MGLVTWGGVVHGTGKYVKPKPDFKGTVVWPTVIDDFNDDIDNIKKEGGLNDKTK